ncbi:MAG: hypothetical protein ABEI86_04590, partial [Halobacteriaceae archaeon]
MMVVSSSVVAITIQPQNIPDSAKVGTSIGTDSAITFRFTNLYTKYDNWTLVGTTDLQAATWTITKYDNQGNQIGNQKTVTQAEFSLQIKGSITTVKVRLEGTVPQVKDYQYRQPQKFLLA